MFYTITIRDFYYSYKNLNQKKVFKLNEKKFSHIFEYRTRSRTVVFRVWLARSQLRNFSSKFSKFAGAFPLFSGVVLRAGTFNTLWSNTGRLSIAEHTYSKSTYIRSYLPAGRRAVLGHRLNPTSFLHTSLDLQQYF